ncbi:MAG: HAD family hydrolase [bacterium]|nr:HAD family hydrolase [bacterium]
MSFNLKAVLFDLDGVLVHSPLDLPAIKRELFGDASVFIIEGIEALPPHEREEKNRILLQRELEAAADANIDPDVDELFSWIESRSLKKGIITRNCREAVNLIAGNHCVDFGVIIAREDAPPKPDPGSVLAACRILEVDPVDCVMVGDYLFDIEAGKNAGCRTVFLETDKFKHLEPDADAKIGSLGELIDVLERWMEE